MATATTLTTIRERLLRELDLGILIPNAFFDAAAAGSITSSNMLRNTRWGSNFFLSRGTVIHRPAAATAADAIRYAGQLTNTTGLLAHTGADYTDVVVTSETVELWYWELRPDREILDAINRALEDVYFSTFDVISHGGDNDFGMEADADVTNWADIGTPGTKAKITTALRTPYGIRSLNIINDAVDEGAQSNTIPATEGASFSAFAVASASVGEASLQPYDVTNSAAIGDPVATAESEPQMLVRRDLTVPTSCKNLALQLIGEESAVADTAWNWTALYKHDNYRINLPSYIEDAYAAPKIFEVIPRYSYSDDVWDAQGVTYRELEHGKDYTYISHHPDANPHAIHMRDGWYYRWPLMVETRRPYSSQGALSAESDTTKAPLRLLMPAVKMRVLAEVLIPREPENQKWLLQLNKAQAEWAAQTAARPVARISRKPYWRGVQAV